MMPSDAPAPPRGRAVVVGLAVLAIALCGAGAASAHTEVEATTPADGARLVRAPAAVVARYSEPVAAVTESSIRVDGTALRGMPAARLATDDASRLRIPLPASAGPGRYSVRWVVRSDDGHLAAATVAFTVADVPVAVQLGPVARAVDRAVRALRSVTA